MWDNRKIQDIRSSVILENGTKEHETLENTKESEPEYKAVVDLLIEAGISPEMSKELAKSHTEGEIRASIVYTETLKVEGKIKNPAGFLVEAIPSEKDFVITMRKKGNERRKIERKNKND